MNQAAWETAMGMRGYAGSPKQQEDRKLLKQMIKASLSHDGRILYRNDIHDCFPSHFNRPRYLKLHEDAGGYYVRTGKRGERKEYIRRGKWLHEKLAEFDGREPT